MSTVSQEGISKVIDTTAIFFTNGCSGDDPLSLLNAEQSLILQMKKLFGLPFLEKIQFFETKKREELLTAERKKTLDMIEKSKRELMHTKTSLVETKTSLVKESYDILNCYHKMGLHDLCLKKIRGEFIFGVQIEVTDKYEFFWNPVKSKRSFFDSSREFLNPITDSVTVIEKMASSTKISDNFKVVPQRGTIFEALKPCRKFTSKVNHLLEATVTMSMILKLQVSGQNGFFEFLIEYAQKIRNALKEKYMEDALQITKSARLLRLYKERKMIKRGNILQLDKNTHAQVKLCDTFESARDFFLAGFSISAADGILDKFIFSRNKVCALEIIDSFDVRLSKESNIRQAFFFLEE